ncbi:nitrite reductase (NAD(P)H) small subunit [Saccharibacillus alkalitolerans]|uniref:Nitrite reductase n=1 Tax=Saccharibacillus alkalitolerans TaxID=2705290 RepID=A0ABX0F9B3_9BACL|nr:nitrite reductase (NAD(P)H) small subunit [Saccharibacillus alkalitolerans]NGZ74592.1 nitrite reductase [Saccharibacillus alkalitolerans]
MSLPKPEQDYTYYRVGTVDDFMERIGRKVMIEQSNVAVFKTSEGEWYALENKSPGPKGGTLAEGIVSGTVLYDPICDWRIRLSDGQVLDPDTGQVRTYPVQIEGNDVRIGIPKDGGGKDNG